MQLSIDITLNNLEPGRYGADSVSRKFSVEVPGTSEDGAVVTKLIIAAQTLAAYDEVIPALAEELNQEMEHEHGVEDQNYAGQPQPPATDEEPPDPADQDPDDGAETAFPTRVQEAE